MRRHVVAAVLAACWAVGAPLAAADPAAEPPPPPAPVSPAAILDPALLLGPMDQLAPTALLDPKTYRMPNGEALSPYVLTQGVPPGPFAFVDSLRGAHAMVHGALGRMPGGELGTALPGTAPPPGTALPPGLEEFLPQPDPPSQPVLVPGAPPTVEPVAALPSTP